MNFADKCLIGSFAFLYLAARKFPAACEVAISALRCEEFPLVADDGGDDVDLFHGLCS